MLDGVPVMRTCWLLRRVIVVNAILTWQIPTMTQDMAVESSLVDAISPERFRRRLHDSHNTGRIDGARVGERENADYANRRRLLFTGASRTRDCNIPDAGVAIDRVATT